MEPLSCILFVYGRGAKGLSELSMFLGLIRILFTIAHIFRVVRLSASHRKRQKSLLSTVHGRKTNWPPRESLPPLTSRHGVRRIVVFARGKAHPPSRSTDVDWLAT